MRTFNETRLWSGATPVEASIAEGVLVEGDRARLRRVVENLVGNAVKYSPDGTPMQVEVRATDEGAIIAVHDRGVGIADEELPHTFSPFYRASTAGDMPGAGLGLTSGKTIVEQHGGQIRVASALGEGTHGGVVLPHPRTVLTATRNWRVAPGRRQAGPPPADMGDHALVGTF